MIKIVTSQCVSKMSAMPRFTRAGLDRVLRHIHSVELALDTD